MKATGLRDSPPIQRPSDSERPPAETNICRCGLKVQVPAEGVLYRQDERSHAVFLFHPLQYHFTTYSGQVMHKVAVLFENRPEEHRAW